LITLSFTRIKRAVICDLFCSTRYLIVKDLFALFKELLPSGRKGNLIFRSAPCQPFFETLFFRFSQRPSHPQAGRGNLVASAIPVNTFFQLS